MCQPAVACPILPHVGAAGQRHDHAGSSNLSVCQKWRSIQLDLCFVLFFPMKFISCLHPMTSVLVEKPDCFKE